MHLIRVALLLSSYVLTGLIADCGYNYHGRGANISDSSHGRSAEADQIKSEAIAADAADDIPWIIDAAFYGKNDVWILPVLGGGIYHTGDGGSNWQHLTANFLAPNSRITFIDSLHGWALSKANEGGQVWQTKDGGRTWTPISRLKVADQEWEFTSPVQIQFIDRHCGWIIETFSVWRTDDGGRKWKKTDIFSSPSEQSQPSRGFFLDDDKAWICGTKGRVYNTSDGGKTWGIKTVDNISEFSNVLFVNESTGWLSSSLNATMYRTENGGHSWQLLPKISEGIHLESAYFINDQIGWAAGRVVSNSEGIQTTGIILHTKDGGQHWQGFQVGNQEPFFNYIYFIDAQSGWSFARTSVYRTQDGGQTWERNFVIPKIR